MWERRPSKLFYLSSVPKKTEIVQRIRVGQEPITHIEIESICDEHSRLLSLQKLQTQASRSWQDKQLSQFWLSQNIID